MPNPLGAVMQVDVTVNSEGVTASIILDESYHPDLLTDMVTRAVTGAAPACRECGQDTETLDG